MSEFDYIIIGGGTAGCIVAGELIAKSAGTVLVVESGSHAVGRNTKSPAFYPHLFGSKWDHGLSTLPQPALRNRRIAIPRGKSLGGSSNMNAMIYVRGHPDDFIQWPASWSYKKIQDSFLAIEQKLFCEPSSNYQHSVNLQFLNAANDAGLPIWNSDPLTRAHLESKLGVGIYQQTQRNGRRISAYSEFLKPCSNSNSLHILSNHNVDRIEMISDRASGVFVSSDSSSQSYLSARKGIILCAGTIHSPCILQASGIGDNEAISAIGLNTRIHNPGVGSNLQDHLVFPIVYSSEKQNCFMEGNDDHRRSWLCNGSGAWTSNLAEVGGFFVMNETGSIVADSNLRPEFQWHVTPTHYLQHPLEQMSIAAWSIGVTDLHPKSRGSVQLRSEKAASDQIAINPAYLSNEPDLGRLCSAIAATVDWVSQSKMSGAGNEPLIPGARYQSRDRLQKAIAAYSQSLYHPVGTCSIGDDASEGNVNPVVDSNLQVYGCDRLYVADASVIPELPSGNTQSTTMMIAHQFVERLIG